MKFINQFIASAVAEKISALTTEDYLKECAQHADKEGFKAILAKAPQRKPVDRNEL